jgi:trehalose-phosphatase
MSVRLFDNLKTIEIQLRSSPQWLLGLDFDGTLAPIVEDPAEARLDPRLVPMLLTLSTRPNVLTVIMSGRERADVETRVGLPALVYAGNHGLDIQGNSINFLEPNAVASQTVLDAMAAVMAVRLREIQGAIVEHKGLTLSVHYRMVDEAAHEEVRHHVHNVLASTDHPFVLTTGKRVFEIRPRTYWNKGTAMTLIRKQLCPNSEVLYLGDDLTDEDAFRAFPKGITIRVGASDETAAAFFLDTQADVFDFLKWFVSRV